MTVGNRCCISIRVKQLWSESTLCTKRTDLQHIAGRGEPNSVRVLDLRVSPKFAFRKQVVNNVNSTQSTMSSRSGSIDKRFWIVSLFTWIVEDQQILCTVVFYETINSKFTRWTNSRFSISFCITSYSGWECWWKKSILLNFGWKLPILKELWITGNFPVLGAPTKDEKTRFFAKKFCFVHSLGEGKMYPAALHRISK